MDGCVRGILRLVAKRARLLFFVLVGGVVWSLLHQSSHLLSKERHRLRHPVHPIPPSSVDVLGRSRSAAGGGGVYDAADVHVCLCSGDTDFRASYVVVRSALEAAADPARLVFHYITTPELAPLVADLFREHLPAARLEVCHSLSVQEHIEAVVWGNLPIPPDAGAGTFAFAPFYLEELLQGGQRGSPRRVIYLHTDTVVLGDLAELLAFDLKGSPFASVPFCTKELQDLVSFKHMPDSWGKRGGAGPTTCGASMALMVVDLPAWKRENVTGRIEDWVRQNRELRRQLWPIGKPKVPWLLAAAPRSAALPEPWLCGSLGKPSPPTLAPRAVAVRPSGMELPLLSRGPRHTALVHVETCSKAAKVLHFDGALKPWLLEPDGDGADGKEPASASPMCEKPDGLRGVRLGWAIAVRSLCRGMVVLRCADLWSSFIDPQTACALKDFDKEWREDEAAWARRRAERQQQGQRATNP